jgi:hypothetical protein
MAACITVARRSQACKGSVHCLPMRCLYVRHGASGSWGTGCAARALRDMSMTRSAGRWRAAQPQAPPAAAPPVPEQQQAHQSCHDGVQCLAERWKWLSKGFTSGNMRLEGAKPSCGGWSSCPTASGAGCTASSAAGTGSAGCFFRLASVSPCSRTKFMWTMGALKLSVCALVVPGCYHPLRSKKCFSTPARSPALLNAWLWLWQL